MIQEPEDTSITNLAKKQMVAVEEKPAEFTTICFNKPPTFKMACITILLIYFTMGTAQGYEGTIILDLAEKGASLADQSTFSMIYYPYVFKIIVAPFLDMYFSKVLGKSKTYIVTVGISLSVIFLYVSTIAEAMYARQQVWELTGLFFSVNMAIIVVQIAGEMWLLKIFDEENKSRGAMFINIGMSSGYLFGYNIFVPLNSVKWLNANIFTKNPISEPILTHRFFLMLIGAMFLSAAIFILLFVAEKKIENACNTPTLVGILKVFAKFFTHANMRNFLIYIVLAKTFYYLINGSLDLKLIEGGLSKAQLVNVNTLSFPVYLLASIVGMRWLVRGSIMQNFHIIVACLGMTSIFMYFLVQDLEHNGVTTRIPYLYFLITCISRSCLFEEYLMGYINTIASEEIGSTFITAILSVNNSAMQFPTSIGYAIAGRIPVSSFDFYAIFCIGMHFFVLFLYIRFPKKLDKRTKHDYQLVEPVACDPEEEAGQGVDEKLIAKS